MKPIHWIPSDLDFAVADELPHIHPDVMPTQSRPAITHDLLVEERKRTEEEREVLRELGKRYAPIGIERPASDKTRNRDR